MLLLTPSASAQGKPIDDREPVQSTPTTLYFHLAGFQDFPINTQRPDDNYTQQVVYGPGTNSLSCIQQTPTTASQEFHTFYGFLSPGYVEYAYIEQGKPRFHPERGISFDAKLDAAQPFTVHWFMEGQLSTLDLDPDPNSLAAPIPNVEILATMRGGNLASIQNHAFNDGEPIAQGTAGPFQLLGQESVAVNGVLAPATAPQGTLSVHTAPSGAPLYEFAVPMTVQADAITRADGANIRIDVYVDNPACADPQEGKIMANLVRVHTSKEFRPHIDLSILNPLRIEYLHPEFLGDGSIAIHASMNSPWGNYDIDEATGIDLKITGPTAPSRVERVAFTQKSHDHGQHQEPVQATYEWRYTEDGGQDGLYTIALLVSNDQQTARATAMTQFQLGQGDRPPCGPDDSQQQSGCVYQAPLAAQSPGAGAIAGMIALVMAAATRGRRGGT